uniref:Uncharacterized protein n=1 Tax=Anguilla anguilla TaxID=7936 RepID=A0A0E9QTG3_ANGAN
MSIQFQFCMKCIGYANLYVQVQIQNNTMWGHKTGLSMQYLLILLH